MGNSQFDESHKTDEELFTRQDGYFEGLVTEKNLLDFAKSILFGIAVIYFMAGVSELFIHNNATYEACKITLPSIATLVIGYYFGSSK
jgi:hypothetical protein